VHPYASETPEAMASDAFPAVWMLPGHDNPGCGGDVHTWIKCFPRKACLRPESRGCPAVCGILNISGEITDQGDNYVIATKCYRRQVLELNPKKTIPEIN